MTYHLLLVLIKIVIVVLGSLIAALAYVAYREHGSRLMLFISIGFGLITLGSVIEGVLFEFLAAPLDLAHVVESAIILAGLLVLVYYLQPIRGGRG